MTLRHFDREGNPITFMECLELETDPSYIRVALTHVGHWSVSTVWLPISHGQDSLGRPLIFEVAVLDGDGTKKLARYAVEADAIARHKRTVEEMWRQLQ